MNENELPPGWEYPKLTEIARINPPLDRCVLGDQTEVTFVPMRAVDEEGAGVTRPEIRTYGEVKKGYTSFLSGDVIMAKITPCMENGKTTVVPDVPGEVCFGSTEFHVLRAEVGVQARWIAQFLLQHDTRHAAQRRMTGGVGQMRVPAAFLEETRIPLSPLNEQERIGETLDELLSDLDAGVLALERVRAKLKLYRASVLKAAVDGTLTADWRAKHPDAEPASELLKRILSERRRRWEEDQLAKFKAKGQEPPKNWKARYQEPTGPDSANLHPLPENWCWTTMDQCTSRIQYGTSSKTAEATQGVPVLRMGNLTADGRLLLDDMKYLPAKHEEFPELLLTPGDLLFNRTNSAELVGKSAVYRGAPTPCSFASYLIRVRFLEGLLPPIAMFALNGGFGRAWVNRVVNQMVGQANVNGTKLAAFTFPLPPLEEQEAIVEAGEDQISIVDHLESDFDAKLGTAQGLRQAILQHAFSGRLVPQDPNDEPASKLLRRIAAEREERAKVAEKVKRPAKRRPARA